MDVFTRGFRPFMIFVAVILLSINNVDSVAVMAVDLGSEWMKIGVVSPGVPMEICLNKDSQRKTPVVIAFRDGERTFGDMALGTQVKFPAKAFADFLYLLGKPIDHPIIDEYKARYPFHQLVADEESGGVAFKHPEGFTFSVEELVAMILKQAQGTASQTAGQPIKDAVITVPAFFNQAERRSMSRAAQIAGINILQLINDNTAFGLNYGVFRRKDFNNTPVNMLFYDMGSGSTKATVLSYQTAKTKDRGYTETAPVMTIRGVGYDRTLGGLEFKMRLAHHLARKFDETKKATKKVSENDRAFFKLVKEAERVKKILSANTEINAQVENVMEDIDLKIPVPRVDFEEMCADLFTRVTKPIDDALASAEMGLDEIQQVIVVGGNTRIPKVQQILEEYLSGRPLGKSVNADEAAAMGAAYQAAYLSKGFKVKTFIVKDANLFPVQLEFSRDGSKNIQRAIFTRNGEYPKKKTILVSKMENDFTVYSSYGDLSFLSLQEQKYIRNRNISTAIIKGVADSLNKHGAEKETEVKGVRIHMHMDVSGIFNIENAETLFEKEEIAPVEESTFSKIGSTLGKLFGGSDAENATEQEPEAEKPAEETGTGEQKEESQDTEKKEDAEKKAEETEEKKNESQGEKPAEKAEDKQEANKEKPAKKVEVKDKLETDITPLDLPAMSEDGMKESMKKLKDLDDKDHARLSREKAVNSLESYILETKDKLSSDEFIHASTDEEREKILEALNKEQEWLEEESDGSDTAVLKAKLTALLTTAKDVTERVSEHRDRPQAIDSLTNLLKISAEYLGKLRTVPEDDSVFTSVELDTLEKVIKETEEWRDEQVAVQAKLGLHESPVLTMKSIFEKIQVLDRETKYLMNKARYAQPKKKPTLKPEPKKTEGTKDKSEDKKDEPKKEEPEVKQEEPDVKKEGEEVVKEETVAQEDVPEAGEQKQEVPEIEPEVAPGKGDDAHTEL